MRRGREAEDVRDVPDVVSRVLRQLRGGGESDEVDDALEVRRAVRREGPAQVLARDAERGGERRGAHGAPRVRDDRAPGVVLERRVEAERRRRRVERRGEAGGEETGPEQGAGG